jgi:hypothetical protein
MDCIAGGGPGGGLGAIVGARATFWVESRVGATVVGALLFKNAQDIV